MSQRLRRFEHKDEWWRRSVGAVPSGPLTTEQRSTPTIPGVLIPGATVHYPWWYHRQDYDRRRSYHLKIQLDVIEPSPKATFLLMHVEPGTRPRVLATSNPGAVQLCVRENLRHAREFDVQAWWFTSCMVSAAQLKGWNLRIEQHDDNEDGLSGNPVEFPFK